MVWQKLRGANGRGISSGRSHFVAIFIPMDLKERIDADIKAAMLAREKDKLNALRAIKSAILLELTKEGANGLEEAAGMKILQKLHKQRMESAAIYHAQQRTDLAQEEENQAMVIEAYLPKRLSEEEVEATVRAIIASTGASGMKDMGRVMGEANKQLAGKADGSAVAAVVKRLLGA
jgi:uncharacterized protein